MYNNELKHRYIQIRETEATLPNNYLALVFNKSEEYEEELEKDISCFTAYEILEFYKIQNFYSIEALQCLNSQLRLYTQWCLQQNLVTDNQNHFLEINTSILMTCVNKYAVDQQIVTRETVLKWIDELPNPKDQFILLSLFEYGKSKNFANIVYARISDLDDKKNLLTLIDGRVVTISDKLKQIAYDSYEAFEYYSLTGNEARVMPLINFEDRIVKYYPNTKDDVSDFQKSRVIYNCLTRILDYVGAASWCSANSIVVSGKIYMIKERAADLGMTPMEYLYSQYLSEVDEQYGGKITRSVFGVKYAEYLK